MLIVQGVFHVAPEKRDGFLVQSMTNMQIARGESGCLEYVLAADPLEPDRVILSERWGSMEEFNAHNRALTKRRQEAADAGNAPAIAPQSRDIAVYEVTTMRSVS
jgi:quinol monooxygenase YgiN